PTSAAPLPVLGRIAEVTRAITDADIAHFAAATGDRNPLHFDDTYAARTRFGGRVAHGMLSAGLISAAIANVLPGPGSAYRSQTLAFKLPVRPGDVVTVRLEVLELVEAKRRVRLSTVCTNQRGETVVEGEAWVTMLA
ncbi:MAG TPA: MaoC family dehydratase, partial [Gemmatirosa sp.]